MKYEPVSIGTTIIGLIMAVIVFAQSMGWIAWNAEQMTNFEVIIAMLVPLVISGVGGFFIRQKTISKRWAEENGLEFEGK